MFYAKYDKQDASPCVKDCIYFVGNGGSRGCACCRDVSGTSCCKVQALLKLFCNRESKKVLHNRGSRFENLSSYQDCEHSIIQGLAY